MDYSFSILDTAPQPIVSIRERHATGELPAFIARTFGSLFQRLGEIGSAPAGPPFVIYHEFTPDTIDAEVCVPVGRVLPGFDAFASRVLPASIVVRTVHVGPYDELGAAYEAMTDWIRTHGAETAGPVRERYLNGPGDGVRPAAYRTEVEMPIVRARVSVLA
jgi:effector-binding domain-containing protein